MAKNIGLGYAYTVADIKRLIAPFGDDCKVRFYHMDMEGENEEILMFYFHKDNKGNGSLSFTVEEIPEYGENEDE